MASKVVLVTGSTRGIGLAIAKKFAAEQFEVILNGFASEEVINNIKEEIKKLNGKDALYISADLTKPSEIDALVEELVKKYPEGVDVLVNNAGSGHANHFVDTKVEDFDSEYALMLRAPFLLCKALVPLMKKHHKAGRVINIASINGKGCKFTMFPGYIAAKHGLIGFTKSLAIELAKSNITVNAICPGATKTPLIDEILAGFAKVRGITFKQQYKEWEETIPMGRAAEPSEMAELTYFISKPEASFITGSSLVIDGGQHACRLNK